MESMKNQLNVKQNASIGSTTTQIAEQNNYYGMSPEEASSLSLKLFLDNFPKLEAKAMEVAKQRAEEFCNTLIQQLGARGLHNLEPFAQPDVQFMLCEAQKDYARVGTEDLLSMLTSLLTDRIEFDDQFKLKMVINKAIGIAKYLLPEHLDYLAVILFGKHVHLNASTPDMLCSMLNTHLNLFQQANIMDFEYLLSLDCCRLMVGKASVQLAKNHGFDKKALDGKYPKILDIVPGDYGLSQTGLVLAITHINNKMGPVLKITDWVR